MTSENVYLAVHDNCVPVFADLLVSLSLYRLDSSRAGLHYSAYSKTVDDAILSWILDMRDLHLPVSCQDARNKAAELITPQNDTFKASAGWLAKFFHRHHLTLGARSSISQKIPVPDLSTRD